MLRITDFTAEYSRGERAVDTPSPRFSWKLASDGQNVVQAAYRLVVTGGAQEGDSGEQPSRQSLLVPCPCTLSPRTRCTARLVVSDNFGERAQAELHFETSPFRAEEFAQAQFVGCAQEAGSFVLFRRFAVTKPVGRARAYASALGMYELYVNGSRAGDMYFAPGWTDYRDTLEYQTYDVTQLLRTGENLLEIAVGKGWYAGSLGVERRAHRYGSLPAALLQLHIGYEDGAEEIVVTDEDWQCRSGYILDSELYDGETQDETAPHEALPLCTVAYDKGNLVAQSHEPCRVTQKIGAVRRIVTPKGEQVFDFGQNLVGFAQLRVRGARGQKIIVRHAEVLDEEGNFYTANLRSAKAEDSYILTGGEQTLSPHFTFHGFRYIQVLGAQLTADMVTACVVHTDMRPTLEVCSSNQKLERLMENIRWSQRGNCVDVPTDCPQRDERMGWTGDANAFIGTAVLGYEVLPFFRKWLKDLRGRQAPDGSLPAMAPSPDGGTIAAALWSDAITFVPWELYLTYGDERILAENFSAMYAYTQKLQSMRDESGLIQSGYQYGDWLAPDREITNYTKRGATDAYFIANAFFYASLGIAAQAARILGKGEAAELERVREELLCAMRREYFTATGRMACETQTALVLALHFGIVPPQYKKRVAARLAHNLEEHRCRLATGFAGTPYLCTALAGAGMGELAGKVLLNEECPGWMYAVNRGATTVWERWDGILPDGTPNDPEMNSFNHYAYGCIGGYVVHTIAGIQPLEAGYRRIRIAPLFTKGIGQISAAFESAYGEIYAAYAVGDGRAEVRVRVPVNTEAEVVLPNGETHAVGSGEYTFTFDTDVSLKMAKYTMDSTVAEVLADERARAVAERVAPQVFCSDAVQTIAPFTFRRAAGFGGAQMQALFESVLAAIEKELG